MVVPNKNYKLDFEMSSFLYKRIIAFIFVCVRMHMCTCVCMCVCAYACHYMHVEVREQLAELVLSLYPVWPRDWTHVIRSPYHLISPKYSILNTQLFILFGYKVMSVYKWAFWSITFFAILFTYSFQGPRKASFNYFSIELITMSTLALQ